MWGWIAIGIYLVIGIILAIWLHVYRDDGLSGVILCMITMPIIVVPFILFWEGPAWIYERVILHLFINAKEYLKEKFGYEERRWRKWKKEFYANQKAKLR